MLQFVHALYSINSKVIVLICGDTQTHPPPPYSETLGVPCSLFSVLAVCQQTCAPEERLWEVPARERVCRQTLRRAGDNLGTLTQCWPVFGVVHTLWETIS